MSTTKVNYIDPLYQAMGLLHFAFRAVVAEADAILERRGLGRVHNRILFFVGRNPDLSVGELLSILGITKQALNRPLAQLCDAGLVQSAPSPRNRRRKRLRLTRAGAVFERQLARPQQRRLALAFAEAGRGGEAAWRRVMALLGGHDPYGRDFLPG